ncbi:hypothetical protein QFC22_005107 [Naganishia vaughanmartiniae]|uniref:Uncharacterized protein n=1 Tax=Naganishia vaughanmartiniae TaxID=1424756 RepID=A0ACC2WXW9_9TREE|nr:hypothetical protein QFC22_005107 [Naganishia vaughanmartiniae]
MAITTSSVFLDILEKAGITHVFVNLGSDHPALLEAFVARERKRKDGGRRLEFITSPNESVALNCAQGYYQACGKPAAVIVHVDCGTQVRFVLHADKEPAKEENCIGSGRSRT